MNDLAQSANIMLGIYLNSSQLNAFEVFEKELLYWNTRLNLTAIQDPKQIRTKHFLDSLTCLLAIDEIQNTRVIDVGTGAGFPGLPLKIYNSDTNLTLVESVGKKVRFCNHICNTLALENTEIIHKRVEALGQNQDFRQQFDIAVARAVAVLPVLVEFLLPLLRVGGKMIAMKGEGAPLEAHDSEHATHVLGGQLQKLIPVTLPGVAEERYLVIIEKVAATPDKYPRRIGIPAKRPLM
jgi:16S rRNA (guanine527-N7)-methyltransferase